MNAARPSGEVANKIRSHPRGSTGCGTVAADDSASIDCFLVLTGRALMPSPPSKPRLLRVLGPGLITGASDDDPSGIATYSQAGAHIGLCHHLDDAVQLPLMVVIQEISARIGRTTGQGIAGNIRQHYPNWLLQAIVALVFVANILNIGADLGATADASALRLRNST